ncbi:hypothetical protein A9Q86_04250 [Flavobacteriales bacterium 33_180_T64]|nr:hypothetical protein A9Q86_04250 [Flavobacteriales bacterium 33_180_T64]
MNKIITLLCSILLFAACKEDNKNVIPKSDATKSSMSYPQLKGYCTQMSGINFTEAVLYASQMQNIDSFGLQLNNKIDLKDFRHYKHYTLDSLSQDVKSNTFNEIFTNLNQDQMQKALFGIQSAVINSKIWKYNELRIYFIDGTQDLKDQVIEYAREWENYCAVNFTVVNSRVDSDITISFNDEGYWSYIGSESLNYYPSMSLTGIDEENEDYFRGTVLHEFGHALGLIHEHQSPNSSIKWNDSAVYDYYWKTHKWSEKKTYENVIQKYRFDQFNDLEATEFDPESIMIYYIPKEFLANDNPVDFKDNNDISDLDKELIRKKYY